MSIGDASMEAEACNLVIHQGQFWDSISFKNILLKGVPKKFCSVLKANRFLATAETWWAFCIETAKKAYADHGWLTAEDCEDILATRPDIDGLEEAKARAETDIEKGSVLFWENAIDRNALNQVHIDESLVHDSGFFKTAEKSPLTTEQSKAVICFDKRTLLIASAGSGKTSVIVAKAAYAIYKGYFNAEEILLLAFNKKAADELAERVKIRLEALGIYGSVPKASTFHAFALSIIGEATGAKPGIAPWVENDSARVAAMNAIIASVRKQDEQFDKDWKLFTAFLVHEEKPEFKDEESSKDFRTARGEFVKSKAEKMLANWLAYHGVTYRYEAEYPVITADSNHRQYRPDFTVQAPAGVPLYIELWALDENEAEPLKFKGYRESMLWKRKLHKKHGTHLLEITSRQVWEGTGFPRLEKELKAFGIVLHPNTPLPGKEAEWGATNTVRLLLTFLSHVKGGRLTKEVLDAKCKQLDYGWRGKVFLKIFWAVYEAWQAKLCDANCIDFDDMVSLAADYVSQGRWKSPYRLVMADEFQDTNVARAELLTLLTSPRGRSLFAVGDDWQGINRFAGSVLSVMTRFEEKFGEASILKLERTFRFSQSMCDITGSFILKNSSQIRKSVLSEKHGEKTPVLLYSVEAAKMCDAIRDAISKISKSGSASILILGRYKSDRECMPSRIPSNIEAEFSTVHAAKGKEADYVLIPNVSSEKRGFPSTIEDDPLLAICTPEADDFLYSEVRRLFYVAVTRARNQAIIFSPAGKISPFVDEIAKDNGLTITPLFEEDTEICPVCGRGFIKLKHGKYGFFYGCTNFPACRYTRRCRR